MDGLGPVPLALALIVAAAAFTVSAAAGLGGSLLLVPTLALVLGAKHGVALAALLLAVNNVCKLGAYWRWVPWRRSLVLAAATAASAALGARVLVALPDRWVVICVLVSLVAAFAGERAGTAHGGVERGRSRWRAGAYVAASGVTSGVSGTSGPLKGLALRALFDDRLRLVAAASLVSLAGDVAKSAVFAGAGVLDATSALVAVLIVPVMVSATFAGRRVNGAIGERGYSILFWSVMGGYFARLVFGLA